ncbi:inversin-like [Salmo trutta]|nr:inversin-like [Salmo trutta]
MDQEAPSTREHTPRSKRDTHTNTPNPRHRTRPATDHTTSSSKNHTKASTQSHRPSSKPREGDRDQAACTIQRAWRRFHVRGRLREAFGAGKGVEPPEVASLLIQLLWDRAAFPGHTPIRTKPEARVPPTKTAAKSSVLQSIYGKAWRSVQNV